MSSNNIIQSLAYHIRGPQQRSIDEESAIESPPEMETKIKIEETPISNDKNNLSNSNKEYEIPLSYPLYINVPTYQKLEEIIIEK